MGEYTRKTIREMINFLIAESYLESSKDKYPVLKLSDKMQCLSGREVGSDLKNL